MFKSIFFSTIEKRVGARDALSYSSGLHSVIPAATSQHCTSEKFRTDIRTVASTEGLIRYMQRNKIINAAYNQRQRFFHLCREQRML
jgi:hypothetical protein